MSIDYLSCSYCGDGFPDVIDYIECSCGRTWCCLECAEEDGYVEDDTDEDCPTMSCKYCREEDFDDGFKLKLCLEALEMSMEDCIKMCKDYKKYGGFC